MPNPPLPDFVTSLDWAGWTSVPTTPSIGNQNQGFLKTEVAPAAAGNVILTPNVGYKYQCALAVVGQDGKVWVNFSTLVLPDTPTAPPLSKSLEWGEWADPLPTMFFRTKLAPSLVAIGPEIFLYAVFHADLGGNPNDNCVSYTSTSNGRSWSPWKFVSGGAKPTNSAPCATPDGKLYLVSSEDGGVWVNQSPTTPDGSWLPVLPPFLTDAGVCASTGNSQSSTASALLGKLSGQESVEYLSPNAQAWSKLVPTEGSSGKTNVALASARITYSADETPGGSILFRTAPNRSIHWSDLFFPDAGTDSWYKPTAEIGWNQLDGFATDQPLAAAVFDSTNYPGGIPSQFLALFAKGVSVGDVKMNFATITVGRAP